MLVVNTNVSSLKAQRELSRTRFSLSVAMERISSGVRLNSAKDDAVGIGVSERMTSQIKGLSMAIKNANDGIGFLQTAEGSLQEVTNLMQQMREMATQAIDGANSASDRASLQTHIRELNAEISRIANQTELNGKKLLNGEIINEEFQIGIRADQTIKISIPGISAQSIGSYSTTTDGTGDTALGFPQPQVTPGEAPPNGVPFQTLTIRGFASDVTASKIEVSGNDFPDGEPARSIAAKVNAEKDRSGVSATAKTTVTLEGVYNVEQAGVQTLVFKLYGKNSKIQGSDDNAVSVTANVTGNTPEGLNSLISAINVHTITTGITATFVAGDPEASTNPGIELVQAEGYDISLEGFRNSSSTDDPTNPGNPSTLTVRGSAVDPVNPDKSFRVLEEGIEDSVTVSGKVTFYSPKPFTVTSDAAQDSSLFKNGFDSTSDAPPQGAVFSAVSDIDFLAKDGASRALQVLTDALDFVSAMRSDIGTTQNRFESTIANLGSVLENTEAARSRINDADFGEETARLTKAQILQEAGIAILAQANTLPQAVLALLRA